jgi:hypothetical protein
VGDLESRTAYAVRLSGLMTYQAIGMAFSFVRESTHQEWLVPRFANWLSAGGPCPGRYGALLLPGVRRPPLRRLSGMAVLPRRSVRARAVRGSRRGIACRRQLTAATTEWFNKLSEEA